MRQALKDALAYILSLLAKAAVPLLEERLSEIAASLFAEAPRLKGAWVVRFDDPAANGRAQPRKIDATLRQFGLRVAGVGHVQGQPGDLFVYRGRIKRNCLYGDFRRRDRRILAGTGTFVVKIAADGRSMQGHCAWFDTETDAPWNSRYGWQGNG